MSVKQRVRQRPKGGDVSPYCCLRCCLDEQWPEPMLRTCGGLHTARELGGRDGPGKSRVKGAQEVGASRGLDGQVSDSERRPGFTSNRTPPELVTVFGTTTTADIEPPKSLVRTYV